MKISDYYCVKEIEVSFNYIRWSMFYKISRCLPFELFEATSNTDKLVTRHKFISWLFVFEKKVYYIKTNTSFDNRINYKLFIIDFYRFSMNGFYDRASIIVDNSLIIVILFCFINGRSVNGPESSSL